MHFLNIVTFMEFLDFRSLSCINASKTLILSRIHITLSVNKLLMNIMILMLVQKDAFVLDKIFQYTKYQHEVYKVSDIF